MENIDERMIFLILFVVISAVKWFMEKVKGKGNQPHEISEDLQDIYQEFREKIQQRQTKQTIPQQEQEAEQPHAIPPLPQQTQLPPVKKPQKTILSAEQKAAAERFERNSSLTTRRSQSSRDGSQTSIRALLASPKSTQQAIILHEVLGKPRSLLGSSPIAQPHL